MSNRLTDDCPGGTGKRHRQEARSRGCQSTSPKFSARSRSSYRATELTGYRANGLPGEGQMLQGDRELPGGQSMAFLDAWVSHAAQPSR